MLRVVLPSLFMFSKFLVYTLIVLGFWFFPDMFLFLHNLAALTYAEAESKTTHTLHLKFVKPVPYLPPKFSVLGFGIEKLRVELNNPDLSYLHSRLTDEYGNTTFENLKKGTYGIRVARNVSYSENDIIYYESRGASVLQRADLLKTSLDEITVSRDAFIVVVVSE